MCRGYREYSGDPIVLCIVCRAYTGGGHLVSLRGVSLGGGGGGHLEGVSFISGIFFGRVVASKNWGLLNWLN